MKHTISTLRKTFVRQNDSSDCGVACLCSLVRYYGGDASVEHIRELSGTTSQGTTMLGLKQAAGHLGLEAAGFEQAEIQHLVEHGQPVILHVLLDGQLEHYIIWYGKKAHEMNLLGDPAGGIITMSDEELYRIWISRKLLILFPTGNFRKIEQEKARQWMWITGLLKEDTGLFSAIVMTGIVSAILGVLMNIFFQKLIDDFLPAGARTHVSAGVGLLIFLLLVKVGIDGLRLQLQLYQSRCFNNRLTGLFFDSLLHMPKRFYDSRKTGDMVIRLNDSGRIQRFVSQLAGTTIVDALITLVSLGVLTYYSWRTGLGLIIALPLFFALVYRYRHSIVSAQRTAMEASAQNESNYISTLQGIRAIQSFNRQDMFEKRNRLIYGNLQNALYGLGIVQRNLNINASVANVVILCGVLAYSCWQVLEGDLKVGEMIAVTGLTANVLPLIAGLALLTVPFHEARIAFDRMDEYMSLPVEPRQTKSRIMGHEPILQSIHVQDLSFAFPGRAPLWKGVSMHIRRGEITGFIAGSGKGKSTLLQVLEGFFKPAGGRIILNEITDLATLPLEERRELIACVPQEVDIFPGTVLENIVMFKKGSKAYELGVTKEDDCFFNQNCFFSFYNTLPQGLNTIVGEQGTKLSGGQKQWVGLMRALIRKPQLLLLDEATSSMDIENEGNVLRLLMELKPDIAVLFVTHRLHLLPRICNRIFVLDAKQGLISGSHDSLLETDNLYSRFWSCNFVEKG